MLILSVSGNSSYCVQMSFFLEIAALGEGLIHFRFWFHFPPKVQPTFSFSLYLASADSHMPLLVILSVWPKVKFLLFVYL